MFCRFRRRYGSGREADAFRDLPRGEHPREPMFDVRKSRVRSLSV